MKFALAAVALMAASTSQAAITVYTNLAAFTAATSNPGTDTYTGFSILGQTTSPITRTAGAYTYTAATPGNFYGAGTTANPWLSTNQALDSITFSGFTSTVRGIGGNFFGSGSCYFMEPLNLVVWYSFIIFTYVDRRFFGCSHCLRWFWCCKPGPCNKNRSFYFSGTANRYDHRLYYFALVYSFF